MLEALGSSEVMASCMLLEEGIHELPSMRPAILLSRLAVMLRMSRDCESSKTYSTWVVSSPKSFSTTHFCNHSIGVSAAQAAKFKREPSKLPVLAPKIFKTLSGGNRKQ